MGEEENPRKRPLVLDWDLVLGQNDDDDDDDDEPPSLVIVKDISSPKPLLTTPMMSDDLSPREDLTLLSDRELNDKIKRQSENVVRLRNALPDKGAKLIANIKALEEERERRKFRRPAIDVDKCEVPEQAQCPNEDGFRQETKVSQDDSQSTFATILIGKMEEKPDCRMPNAFGKDLLTLGRYNHQNPLASNQKRRQTTQSSERHWPLRSASSFSCNRGKLDYCNGNQNGKPSSPRILRSNSKSFGKYVFNEKDDCTVLRRSSSKRKKDLTVVLVDEEEAEVVETEEQANQLDECMKDAKIYYPSRDDPDSAEICYKDIQCLAPEGFLTSPIMNFYIRYLWMKASPTNRAVKDCHFFNTFFYWKLTEAVSYKGSDPESYFQKFRRWWRGVNIFEKAYIFIPVHENLHWSLAIICIPDKEDDSGPVILHLDSLRLHRSKSVFNNIKSFLREEWSFMNHETRPTDLPITDRIWKRLPRRIDERVITVPQQKNEYDCGLFVLFFMQRFIEEAPERLKKKDLAMFGNRWFKPEEASGLRVKIRDLLLDEFRNAEMDKNAESTRSGT